MKLGPILCRDRDAARGCPIRRRFIERMGDHMEAEGAPRIAGRLFGLMILEGGPVSFGDLASRLAISRGSVSTNARLLESQGLIERVDVPGQRQDFFRLADQPYTNLLRMIVVQMQETTRVIVETQRALPPEADPERARLESARRFFDAALVSLDALISSQSTPTSQSMPAPRDEALS